MLAKLTVKNFALVSSPNSESGLIFLAAKPAPASR